MSEIDEQVRQFCDCWQEMNMIYEDYARSVDIPYTTLYILSYIARNDGCTQKAICEKTFLPKQTVNTVITGFYKKGLVTLVEDKNDRRTKLISLTESGRAYAEKVIPQISAAEREAMESLTEQQRGSLLEGMRIYGKAFRAAMFQKEKS